MTILPLQGLTLLKGLEWRHLEASYNQGWQTVFVMPVTPVTFGTFLFLHLPRAPRNNPLSSSPDFWEALHPENQILPGETGCVPVLGFITLPRFAMKWWDQMPWLFFECWVLSRLFHSFLSLSTRGSSVSLITVGNCLFILKVVKVRKMFWKQFYWVV